MKEEWWVLSKFIDSSYTNRTREIQKDAYKISAFVLIRIVKSLSTL